MDGKTAQLLVLESTGKRLCDTCSHGTVMRGKSRPSWAGQEDFQPETQEEVLCHFTGRVINIDVTECTRYAPAAPAAASLATQAVETAWVM